MFDRGLDSEQVFGQGVIEMGRTRVRRRRTATVAAILACLLVGAPVSRAFSPPRHGAHPRTVYVVRPGDTVWSIAMRFAGGSDPRPLVDAIGRRNGVEAGTIVPGQALWVPSLG